MAELVKSTELNYGNFEFHEAQENLVDILVNKTGKNERGYFRVLVAYKMAEIASHMRTSINYLGDDVPVNMYGICLASSGFSKDKGMNILDKRIFNKFRDKFQSKTFQEISELNLQSIADLKSITESISLSQAEMEVNSEYQRLPKFLYSFGASTMEGYKSLRTKLSMAEIGATSFIMGEIGSMMNMNSDALASHLDSYDMGLSKQKLIKNESNADMMGAVPSNLFMFGTQSKLFDGARTEEEFFSWIEEGYGRRLVIGYVENHKSANTELTSDELYDIATDTTTDLMMTSISSSYEGLADAGYYNQKMTMTREVAKIFIQYRSDCEAKAELLRSHEDIKKAVLGHGYWKAVKIAGAYAFIDEEAEITEVHAKAAIALIEQSNNSYEDIARRPTAYVKLIEYMADVEKEITQVELVENLPFYKGSESQKKELMTLAIAHGYRNKIVVRKTYSDGVEFFKAERLEETDLDQIQVSWSTDITEGYEQTVGKWEDLKGLVCADGYHYTVNHWEEGHRNGDNLIEGFNLCVLDVDSGTTLSAAKALLSEYQYLMYETKRSTPAKNRFRIIIPLSHKIKLNREDFKEFMTNIFEFMPFNVDEGTADCARKWQSNKGAAHYNEGKLLDVYDFLPKTKKQEEMSERSANITNADSVQRYFLLNHSTGRNNAALNYAMMLMDNGESAENATILVREFNNKLVNPLNDKELTSTVFRSIYRKEDQLIAESK